MNQTQTARKSGETSEEIPVYRFEWEVRGRKTFNLYERGGGRYLAPRFSGTVIDGNKGPYERLDMLYPVAQVDYNGKPDESFKKAIAQFIKLFDIAHDFKFHTTPLVDFSSSNDNKPSSGKATVTSKGYKENELESIVIF